jgi:hypothetical protein
LNDAFHICFFPESIRRVKETKSATDKEINDTITSWFTGGRDRKGGKTRRDQKAQEKRMQQEQGQRAEGHRVQLDLEQRNENN